MRRGGLVALKAPFEILPFGRCPSPKAKVDSARLVSRLSFPWSPPMRSAICSLAIVASLTSTAIAQVTISAESGQARALNQLPVTVILHAYSPATKAFSTIMVPAGGQAPVNGATTVLTFEPIAVELERFERFRSCTVGLASKTDLQAIVAELKAIDFLETSSAKDRIAAKSTLARLELEQHWDEQATYLNDPLRNELRRQQERYASEAQKSFARTQEQLQRLGSDVTAMALAWESVEQERLKILHGQFKTFEPLIQQARMAYQIRQRELDSYTRAVVAWQSYSIAVVKALDEEASTLADEPIVVQEVRKRCSGPSLDWDWVEIDGPNRADVASLVAEVTFDRGGKQNTYFRRLSKSSRWTGRIDWPPGSTSASLRLRWPGSSRWQKVNAKIPAQRKSISNTVAEARKAVAQIEKKLKEANFRAAGGDRLKTAPVF